MMSTDGKDMDSSNESQTMRVLFVTRKYPPSKGGMQNLSFHLTTRYPGRHHTVLALGRSQKHLIWFLPYVLMRVSLTAWRFDVVHLGDSSLALVGALARGLFGKRVFVTLHGLDLTYRSRFYQWYLSRFLCADGYFAVSRYTARLARRRGLSPVTVIPAGVAEPYSTLAHDPLADEELASRRCGRTVLLTVGRLVPRKGVAWFVRNVLPALPDTLYVVAGEGPDRARILSMAAAAGVGDRVLLLGEVDESRLHALYRASDIFLMPNIRVARDIEGFGIVALEASASGLPVVAARMQGLKDAIEEGKNGLLFPAGDAAGIRDRIRELIRNEPLRRRLATEGRDYTVARFRWEQIVQSYLDGFRAPTVSLLAFPFHDAKTSGRGVDRYLAELSENLQAEGWLTRIVDPGFLGGACTTLMTLWRLLVRTWTARASLYHAVTPIGGAVAVLLRKKPLVVSIHDVVPFHDDFQANSWKRRVARWGTRICLRHSAATIVPFQVTKHEFTRELGAAAEKVAVVRYGVDHSHYFPRPSIEREDDAILYLGEVSIAKGIETLLRAFQMVKEKRGSARLTIAGKPGREQRHLEELARALHLRDIHFAGYVPEDRMPALYCAATVMVFPSHYGFGLSTLEAMACGVPVVAVASLDAPEFLGDFGLQVRAGDAGDCAEKILSVLQNPSLQAELSRKGRQRSLSFSWGNTARETGRVYAGILRQTPNHRSDGCR